MFNFIVCDDEKIIRKRGIKTITQTMKSQQLEYNIHEFSEYNKDFYNLVKENIGKKIYILDVEVKDNSGLDIARYIRENEWDSVVVILTVHYELLPEVFKSRLLIYDFISKFDNYEKKLQEIIEESLKVLTPHETLNFKYKRTSYKIDLKDILYIKKETSARHIIIKTFFKDYKSAMTLSEVIKRLNNNFCRSHRACIINTEHVKSINYQNSIITFKNGEEIGLLSKQQKKEVKKKCPY